MAILLSLPLMLVGLRVLGETNWGPISALSNMMQGIFGALAPGNIAANMVASGTTGTIARRVRSDHAGLQGGDMIGSTPRYLTIMQLIATPVGAAAVSWMYPLLREDLRHRRRTRRADLADLAQVGGLRRDSVAGRERAAAGRRHRARHRVPPRGSLRRARKPAGGLGALTDGIGIGMLVPAAVIFVMFLGSVVDRLWWRTDRRSHQPTWSRSRRG